MPTEEPASKPPPATVEALVANHRVFLEFLEKRVGDRATAEDILQEAFVRGLSRADSIRDAKSAVAWFYRLLRNAVIDQSRRGAARTKALGGFAAEVAKDLEPSQDAKANICACVGELAGTLKPEYAAALRRVEIDGLPVKDYAAEVGISSGNAAVRIFRAREALRKQVTRSCGTCATHGCLDCTCGSQRARQLT